MIATTMVGVREQAKVREDDIHSTINHLISLLRDREAALISDVETARHQKEKELQLKKDELEFLLSGIRQAGLFSKAMMKEGSDTEIVASHWQVVTRMTTLIKEREKAQLEPVVDPKIEFILERETVSAAMKDLGTVVATGVSAEQSTIETPPRTNHRSNQVYSFQVRLLGHKGNKVSSEVMKKAVKSLAVGITGTSEVKVRHSFALIIIFRSPVVVFCHFLGHH